MVEALSAENTVNSTQQPVQTGGPSSIVSTDLSDLAKIYQKDINIVVWQRSSEQKLSEYAQQVFLSGIALQEQLAINEISAFFNRKLPEHPGKASFIEDLCYISEMFACLFDLKYVGLRLTPLTKAMCPKFHTDKVPCRLATTYMGNGTQLVDASTEERNRLLTKDASQPEPTQPIYSLSEQEVVLLKGEQWEGNEGHGAIHRSPRASSDQPRILLTLDFA